MMTKKEEKSLRAKAYALKKITIALEDDLPIWASMNDLCDKSLLKEARSCLKEAGLWMDETQELFESIASVVEVWKGVEKMIFKKLKECEKEEARIDKLLGGV